MREATSGTTPIGMPTAALSLRCPLQPATPSTGEKHQAHPAGGTFWNPRPVLLTPGRPLKQEPEEVRPPRV